MPYKDKAVQKVMTKRYYDTHKDNITNYQKEYGKNYRALHPEKEKDRRVAWTNANLEHVKETQKQWYQNNKVARKAYILSNIDKIKPLKRRLQFEYRRTPKGALLSSQYSAKRKREFGYNLINQYVKGFHGHHVDKNNVIFIPKELHKSVFHTQNDNESMMRINILVWSFLEASVL